MHNYFQYFPRSRYVPQDNHFIDLFLGFDPDPKSRAPRFPATLPTPLSIVQLCLYIRCIAVYFCSPLYPPCLCSHASNTFPCDSPLCATSTFTGYGSQPWPLPAAASNFHSCTTPTPRSPRCEVSQHLTGPMNSLYRTYSSLT